MPYHQPIGFQIFSNKVQRLKTYILAQKDATTKVVYSLDKELKPVEQNFQKDFLIDNKDGCRAYQSQRTLSSTHGGSFIDLNMDCRPDLALETTENGKRVYEVYYFRDGGFCLVEENEFVEDNIMDSTSISYIDMGQRGSNDAVLVRQKEVDGKKKLFVHVFLNKNAIKVNGDDLCQSREASTQVAPVPPFEAFDLKTAEITKVKIGKINFFSIIISMRLTPGTTSMSLIPRLRTSLLQLQSISEISTLTAIWT